MKQHIHDVAILGSGFAGLSAAYHLAQQGHHTLILDPNAELGGLVASYDLGDYQIEKFYHHLQRNDHQTAALMTALGIGEKLCWLRASTGYLVERRLYPLDTPLDILRFKVLSLGDKIRLARFVSNIKKRQTSADLDQQTAQDWITQVCGARVYQQFFAPLMQAKFGNDASKVSAAWLVGRIQFRAHRTWRGESLGYVEGGFQTLLNALAAKVKTTAQIQCGEAATGLEKTAAGDFAITCRDPNGLEKSYRARSVITTLNPPALTKLFDWPLADRQQLEALAFQKTICALVAVKRPVTPVYWCNIANPNMAFGLLIEHTNFYRHPNYPPALLYLANYLRNDQEPLWQMRDEQILQRYYADLEMHFAVRREEILWGKISRATNSGLIYLTGMLAHLPKVSSSVAGLFTIGMLRSFPERSINDAICQGEQAATTVHQYLSTSKG